VFGFIEELLSAVLLELRAMEELEPVLEPALELEPLGLEVCGSPLEDEGVSKSAVLNTLSMSSRFALQFEITNAVKMDMIAIIERNRCGFFIYTNIYNFL
jgi:hypothetical protein